MIGGAAISAAAVEQIAARLAQDPARARREVEALLRQAPNDPRLRLIQGSALRRLGQPKAARAVLQPLASAYPRAANTAYELGLTLADLGEVGPAQAALHHAVSLNRDLADAWRDLGDLAFRRGDTASAEAAYAEHARAGVTDPALKPAAAAIFQGDLDTAETLLRRHLLARLDDAAATRMLAEIHLRRGRYPEAEVLFDRCLALNPADLGARFSYADALFKQQKAQAALAEVERLLAHAPDDPAYLNLQAACLGLVGDDAGVLALYARLARDYPLQPRLWLNYGHALRAVGRRQEAIDAYRRCIDLAPGLGDAYWSLANLKVASVSQDQDGAMRAQLARPDLADEDRLHLGYALGKTLEDEGRFEEAFASYAEAARIRRAQIAYDTAQGAALAEAAKAQFTPDFFAARAGWGAQAEDPIFIVGLPRSGSTLIEQILASHPLVEGTMELPQIGLIAAGLGVSPGAAYPSRVAGLDRAAAEALGRGYVEATRIYRRSQRPRFIDKMPPNFQHVALIQLILPRARIIDARRHPLGAGFSAFKQHFAQGQSFSYDLREIGLYYRDYVELMCGMDRAVPGRVRRLIYEDLVEDTEAQVRRLLDDCGLPFDEACLRFHENRRAVRTVSSEQVRRPIFRDGLEQWRRFEAWLGPMKDALGPVLEDWRG